MTVRIPVRIRTADIDPDPLGLHERRDRLTADLQRAWAFNDELDAMIARIIGHLERERADVDALILASVRADMALNRVARRRKDAA